MSHQSPLPVFPDPSIRPDDAVLNDSDGCVILGDDIMSRTVLMDRSRRLARSLHEFGIVEDDRIALLLRNDFAFLETALAANQLGAYAVPMNWHLTSDELASVLDNCNAATVVCHTDLYPLIKPVLKDQKVIMVTTPAAIRDAYGVEPALPASPEGVWDYEDLLNVEPWTRTADAIRSNIIYTSGTTGAPKGVVREPASGAMAERVREVLAFSYGLSRDIPIRTVITGPLYHSVPNVYAMTAVRSPGSVIVLQPRFSAEGLLRVIAAYGISHLHLVPTMFVRLLKLPQEIRDRYDLSSLKIVAHGAAPCPAAVKKQMISWWGPIIREYYGASETGPAVVHGSEEALQKPGTVGRANPWATVKVLDEAGNELPPDTVGLVYLGIEDYPRSHYLGNPEATTEIKMGGLTTAGELGYLDGDGYLFLTGRAKEMIVSGGVNIFPVEIEDALLALDGVHDCAVFGIPDAEFGESVCAHIEPEKGADLDVDEIRDSLALRIARYKIPRKIVFDKELPREDSGKILKRNLKSRYS